MRSNPQMMGGSRRCSRPWTPAAITVAIRDSLRHSMRAERTADAAVRIPVMYVPSITQDVAAVLGSNRLIRARWLGRSMSRLPSKTLTILTVICMPERQAGIAREKPLPATDNLDRGGD